MGNYIDECQKRGLNHDQMNEVILGLKHHLTTTQVDLYAQEKYDFMRQLVCCIYVVELWIEQGKCLQEGLRKGKVARADVW